jgi:hypothetical protein
MQTKTTVMHALWKCKQNSKIDRNSQIMFNDTQVSLDKDKRKYEYE